MATPIDFPGVNTILKAPQGHEETVQPLYVYNNGQCNVSCWELTDEELATIARTKHVYVAIWSGATQHPIYVGDESAVRAIVQDYGTGAWRRY